MEDGEFFAEGPSPRIRGESDSSAGCCHAIGTIPANTGRIRLGDHLLPRHWDHPREYGENRPRMLTKGMNPGPSPRIRGEYQVSSTVVLSGGTIPANTGRIGSDGLDAWDWSDHPREYGENAVVSQRTHLLMGPSPRIRGEYEQVLLDVSPIGTIPANTGRMPHPT